MSPSRRIPSSPEVAPVPRFRAFAPALAALLLALPAAAQEARPGPAAEAVARAAFRALEERRWGDVAGLTHPDALRRFRAHQVRSARSMENMPRVPYREPGMPEEVAQWYEERSRKSAAAYGAHLERELGVRTAAELEALSAEELFTRWLRSRDPMEMMLRELSTHGRPVPVDSVAAHVPRQVRSVVGSVVQDDSTVLVVYNAAMKMDTVSDMERPALVTLRRSPAGWRLWSGERDYNFLGDTDFTVSVGVELDEDTEKRLNEAKDEVVTWPAGAVPAGRAFITGYPGGMRPPRALVVETAGPGGAPVRVEVPVSAFEALMDRLLMPWTGLEEEPAQAPARP
ncbi:MAG TPA: hypothetical protein VF615_12225 [Longimicrobiaceae bacterium]|jgi:hypothetical protein